MKKLNLKKISEPCVIDGEDSIDIHYDSEYMKNYKKLESMIGKKIVCSIVGDIIECAYPSSGTGLNTMMYSFNDTNAFFKDVEMKIIPMQCEPNQIQISIDFTDIDIEALKLKMNSDNMNIMIFEVTNDYKIIKGLGTISLPIMAEIFTFRYNSLMNIVDVIKHMKVVVCEKNSSNDKNNIMEYAKETLDFHSLSSIIEDIKNGTKRMGFVMINSVNETPLLTLNLSPIKNEKAHNILDYIDLVAPYPYIEDDKCKIDIFIKKPFMQRYEDVNYIALVLIDISGEVTLIRDSIRRIPGYIGVIHYEV